MSTSSGRPQTPAAAGNEEEGQPLTPPSTVGKAPSTPQKRGGIKAANLQLLTPPSTGGLGKTVRFAADEGTLTRSKRRRFNGSREDESAIAEYAELEDDDVGELSDISISDESPVNSSPPSPLENPQSSLLADKDDAPVETIEEVTTTVINEPFPFMKLPLSVRKKVYEVLLVVPGLVCVRQNHTCYHNEEKAYLYAESRLLLPGIAYALPQVTVGGSKVRFSCFKDTNAAILRASKEVHAEAKAVMYGGNAFEIVCPAQELSPPPDYSIKLFPRGCQRYVSNLSIRVRALYPLHWLLNGGFTKPKSAYRGLETLTIIFEMECATKGVGKSLCRKDDEGWAVYVTRLQTTIATSLFPGNKDKTIKTLPPWIDMRVLFTGEAYDDTSESTPHKIVVDLGPGNASPTDTAEERLRRYHLKRGLPEAFEMFKK